MSTDVHVSSFLKPHSNWLTLQAVEANRGDVVEQLLQSKAQLKA